MHVYLPLIVSFILSANNFESVSPTANLFGLGNIMNDTLNNILQVRGVIKHKIMQIKKKYEMNPSREQEFIEVDGVKHLRIHEGKASEATKIENEYQRFLTMEDFKYVYKRDGNWRTWRELEESNGTNSVLNYKFQNVENTTCDGNTSAKRCHRAGFWIKEEKAPKCPYEFFSQVNDDTFCGANINQEEITNTCMIKIKMWNVSGNCDNPLKTTWYVTRQFKKKTQRRPDDICKGRDLCQFSTIYTIKPTYAVFRIVNTTNHITYSRVMRRGMENFACVTNCGIIDLKTLQITPESTTAYTQTFELHRDNHKVIKAVGENPVNVYDREWIARLFTRKPRKRIVYVPCSGRGKNSRMYKLNSILDKEQEFEAVTMLQCNEFNMLGSGTLEHNDADESRLKYNSYSDD